MSIAPTPDLLEDIVCIIKKASSVVLKFYEEGFNCSVKADGSPLTQADLASNKLITQLLYALTPEVSIISEENEKSKYTSVTNCQQFWLVDPLDGTKEFINGNGDFTINIALIDQGKSILGVIASPAQNTIYAGLISHGAYKLAHDGKKKFIHVSNDTKEGLCVVGSRSHGDKKSMDSYLTDYQVAKYIPIGSSIKFCKIAEGSAHIYPRLGRTMEWDTAAGHAILLAAGGYVETLDKTPLVYGKPGFENPHFIAKSQISYGCQ